MQIPCSKKTATVSSVACFCSCWSVVSHLPEGNSLEAVRVMDLSGKTVRNLEMSAAAANTEIDLSGLPKGIYALQARAEGQVFVKKVVVE